MSKVAENKLARKQHQCFYTKLSNLTDFRQKKAGPFDWSQTLLHRWCDGCI